MNITGDYLTPNQQSSLPQVEAQKASNAESSTGITSGLKDLMSNLREFLNQAQAETIFFHAKNPQKDIRAELSETEFRWMEKSPYLTQSFLFSFETKMLMYNNQLADPSFGLDFSNKLENFDRDLKNGNVRIFIKPKGGTL